MDLSIYTGKNVDLVRSELIKLGFAVIITENFVHEKENSNKLVVLAREIKNNVIELIVGSFTFLS